MNGFRKMQERLREEGWYVGWNHYCCQSCAWMDVPDYFDPQYDKDGYLIREDKDGNQIEYEEVNLSKVLFNHSQDCQYDLDEAFMQFFGEDEDHDEFFEEYEEAQWAEEDGQEGAVLEVVKKYGAEEVLKDEPEGLLREGSFTCFPPEIQTESMFCFDGQKEGVKNLKEIIPIIEECGCKVHWNGKGDSRPSISWEL